MCNGRDRATSVTCLRDVHKHIRDIRAFMLKVTMSREKLSQFKRVFYFDYSFEDNFWELSL